MIAHVFEKAVAIDPGFALANYQIAYLGVWTDLPQAERGAALDAEDVADHEDVACALEERDAEAGKKSGA